MIPYTGITKKEVGERMKKIILSVFILAVVGLILIPLVQAHPYNSTPEGYTEEEFVEYCVEVMGEGDVQEMLEICSEIYDTEFNSIEEMLDECNDMAHMMNYCHEVVDDDSNFNGYGISMRNNGGYCH